MSHRVRDGLALAVLCWLIAMAGHPVAAQEPALPDTGAIDTVVRETTAVDTAAVEKAPVDTVKSDTAAVQAAPIDTPVVGVPAFDSTPVDTPVADTTSTQAAPADTNMVDTTAVGAPQSVAAGAPIFAGAEPKYQVSGGDRLGLCLVTLPDQNKDGKADVAVGASGSDRAAVNAGAVWILSGYSGDTLRALDGERPGDAFGAALAACGDVDGDGVVDLAVGAPLWDRDSQTDIDVGKIYVLSGASGSVLYGVEGPHAGARLGTELAALDDTNGDGVRDLAVALSRGESDSAQAKDYASGVWVLSGVDGAVLLRLLGEQPNEGFGGAIASAGDLDRDGRGDLLVGASRSSHGSLLSTGAVYAFSGSSGANLRIVQGMVMFGQFGSAVAGARDVNSDQVPDFAVGARFEDRDGGRRGCVYLFSGSDGSLIGTFPGGRQGQQFGSAVEFTADLDADARPDFWVGAPGHARGDAPSEGVYAISAVSGAVIVSRPGSKPGDRFGNALDTAPDLDGDGISDLFVGAPYSSADGLYAGACYAVSGRTGAILWSRAGHSSLKPAETQRPVASLMNLEELEQEVAGYDFPLYDTSEVDAAPIIRRSSEAVYPESELGSGKTGWVRVKILVLQDGTGVEWQIVDDAGLGTNFADAALAAVKDWSFLPASRAGETVACWGVFPIGFAPNLSPEEQRRIDSLAGLNLSSGLSVDSSALLQVMMPGDSGAGTRYYELDEVDVKPVLSARVEPEYPSSALPSGETCTVKIRVLVNGQGAVADAQVTDVTVPSKGFETAAVSALRRWRYEPAKKAGVAVAVWVPEEIQFTPPSAPEGER